ncbi:uncharacterized protein LOC133782825 [Humulus lupulus]|uniref:uncharacterized protein LOC133782825 n=1 Tax=Humulus lupulus TaxID=3486 RepID=UPI002B403295|nr:uncharacterized protein LOC133782825 [Humulus lupulus]
MEVGLYCSKENSIWVRSVLESMVVETVLTVGKSLTSLLFTTSSLLNDANVSLRLSAVEERFPFDQLHKLKRPVPENKDSSDTEDDDDEDDADDANDQDDDAGDEDFSGEEGDEEADPEDDPEANGEGGSDDDDDDDEEDDDGDDDDDEDGEDEDEEEDEDEDEETPQPPAKKRK